MLSSYIYVGLLSTCFVVHTLKVQITYSILLKFTQSRSLIKIKLFKLCCSYSSYVVLKPEQGSWYYWGKYLL